MASSLPRSIYRHAKELGHQLFSKQVFVCSTDERNWTLFTSKGFLHAFTYDVIAISGAE
jgi:hypothetical protein